MTFMPHCHWLDMAGSGLVLVFLVIEQPLISSHAGDKKCGVSLLDASRKMGSSLSHRDIPVLLQTGQEQGLADGKDIWNYFLGSLMALLFMS